VAIIKQSEEGIEIAWGDSTRIIPLLTREEMTQFFRGC
jgi:hypothetical protein